MKAREKGDASSWFGMPRWIALFLAAVAIAGIGFLLWLTAETFSRSTSVDARRIRALNIAADYIARWPDVATTIGQTSLYHRTAPEKGRSESDGNVFFDYLYHPEFGEFRIRYDRGQPSCPKTFRIDRNRLTVQGEALKAPETAKPEMTYVETARAASWISLDGIGNPVCFEIANLDLGKVAPPLGSFSHLLLIEDSAAPPPGTEEKGKDATGKAAEPKATDAATNKTTTKPSEGELPSWREGRVIGWVGQSELPIRKLSDLPALESEVSKVVVATAEATYAATTTKQASQGAKSGPTDALEPFDSKVAGKKYRFYWRPIALGVPDQSAEAGGQSATYYLVGVAPIRAAPEPGRSRTEVLAFAAVLFMLIALVPVVKLALLGPVDSMRPIEVAAICLGIVAATALGTAFWIGSRDVLVARTTASPEVQKAAGDLVSWISGDLHTALFSDEMNKLSEGFGRGASADLVDGFAPAPTGIRLPNTPIVKVETVALLDANGRQAAGTVVKAERDHVGANFDLGDRVYFKRATDRDFAPYSNVLLNELKQKYRLAPCDIWRDVEDGLVFDQIRARTDGAPKTIVAAKFKKAAPNLSCGQRPIARDEDERLRPSVVISSFTMPSMLSPTLRPGIRYAVIDVREEAIGHPVLFHSDSYRAGVELFDESLNPRTRARLSRELGDPIACANPDKEGSKPFIGTYEEETSLFAVARVPCTDWAVVTFRSRPMIDSEAVKPALHAIIVWGSLTIFPYFLWMVATLWWGDCAWVCLWPEPTERKKDAYRRLALALAATGLLAVTLMILISPLAGALLSWVGSGAALWRLQRVHKEEVERRAKEWIKPEPAQAKDPVGTPGSEDKPAKRPNEILDQPTEHWFSLLAVMLLITVSVVPVAAFAADARAYFAQVAAAEEYVVDQATSQAKIRMQNAIARMEGVGDRLDEGVSKPAPPCDKCPHYFTESLRKAAGFERGLGLLEAPPSHWGPLQLRFTDDFALFSLALVIAVVLGLSIWSSTRGLFGFGVAIEAVDYPQLPVRYGDERRWFRKRKKGWFLEDDLPPRFLVIRARENHLEALRRDSVWIDLNDHIKNDRPPKLPPRNPSKPGLLLIDNLGLLLGDPESRRKALERLEWIIDRQGDPPGFRIAILTSLTPLERLLQSFEREREENVLLDEQQKSTARLERAKYREDMRWSAVFEEFTTYFHATRKRRPPCDLDEKGEVVKRIWKELEYVPDHVVAAMIWDPEKPLIAEEILNWADGIQDENPETRAIVDFLASNLIEHYHLVWSLSSRAERLLLYRMAHGHVPNIAKAYALRSLVKRGLVVLDPYPRTMNESFAQFVRHVEKPETIKIWRQTQEHGFWEGARLLFGLALPIALGVLILAAIRNGDSIASVVPLLVAAGPALINALGSARRTAAA